jgi:hypothetical protein
MGVYERQVLAPAGLEVTRLRNYHMAGPKAPGFMCEEVARAAA